MSDISNNLDAIRERIAAAAQAAGRDPGAVQLLAVSKKHPARAIREAIHAGQTRFGENIAQEGIDKVAELKDQNLEWHFLGRVQSNKTALLADAFDWVQSIDRGKIARRLNAARADTLPPLNVCLQLNLENESSKAGLTSLNGLLELAEEISGLPRLRLRGVMAIPPPTTRIAIQRAQFNRVRNAYRELRALHGDVDTLSIGMTDDFESAISEGSTMVRIGTAIFGARR